MNVTEIGTKKSRKHCSDSGYCQRDSAEHEGDGRVLTEKRITENNITDADREVSGLLERILDRGNLNRAYKQVKKNKGSHGADGMRVEHLLQYLKDNGEELRKTILDGKYRPKPVRRVEIPKDNGKTTVLSRSPDNLSRTWPSTSTKNESASTCVQTRVGLFEVIMAPWIGAKG